MNALKKLLGICEHKWELYSFAVIRSYSREENYDALNFTAQIMCKNCGEHKNLKSEYFDENSISPSYHSLSRRSYWPNISDCQDALMKTPNAKIAFESFNIKSKKEYNI